LIAQTIGKMIKQYPHYLFKHVVTESTQNADGSWSQPTDSWVLHSECREETNGKGQMVNGPDGRAVVYSSNVFMPKSEVVIADGTEVLVSETNSELGVFRIKGRVLKFSKGQLNIRLWV
jgi:hypothetical protein